MQIKKSISNIILGFLSQIITIVLNVVILKLFIISFGSEMNGLVSSITQMFVYLSLFEAGVGTATLVALYGPVANDDKQSINEILAATKIYYNKTGLYYFASIMILAIAYPLVITTGIPTITVMLIIILTGSVGAINYFFQGKLCILLQAEGKDYIITSAKIIVNILTSIPKILLLLNGFNVITVQATHVVFNLVQIFYIYFYIKKNYKWLNLKAKPDFVAISKKNSVLVHQVSNLIFSNTDVIILTIFCNLKLVSVYTLYTMLFATIGMALGVVTNGTAFILGQAYNTDLQRFKRIQDTYEMFYMALVFSLNTIAYIFVLPFVKLYTSGITDVSYIDQYLPLLFVCVNLLSYGRATSSQVITCAGHFKETRWRSIFESSINVTCSLVFVNIFGIYGVLIGTIIALLYRANDIIIYANKRILNRSPWKTYRRWLLNLCLSISVVCLFNLLPIKVYTYMKIFGLAAICCILIIPYFFAVNLLFERDTYKYTVHLIRPYIKKIFK